MRSPIKAMADRPIFSPAAGVLLAVLAASTASIFIRYAQSSAPSLAIAAWRMLISTAALVPIALVRHRRDFASVGRRDLTLIGLSGACLALHFAAWITSLAYTTVASSVVLVSIAPLFVSLLAPMVLREKIEWPAALGIGLAFLGVVIIAASDACPVAAGRLACPGWTVFLGGEAIRGDLLALSGAASVAGYMLIGRSVRSRLALIPYITLTYGAAALVLVALTLLARQRLFGFSPGTYGWILLLALIPQLIAHSTYNWALKYLPAAFVSISLLGEPVGSTALAYVLLGEIPSGLKLAGAAMILVGIVLALRRPARPAQVQGGR